MAEDWSWRRSQAQPWVESLSIAGWSGVDILKFLRGQDMGYRMTNLYADRRGYLEIAINVPYVKRLDPDEFIPRTWTAEVSLWRGGRKHWYQPESLRYRMEAVFRDPETGEESIEYKALMSNRELTKAQVVSEAREKFPWDAYGDGRELVGLEVIALYHLKGTPY